jgi:transcriptional regulator with XRE-family HTH domain
MKTNPELSLAFGRVMEKNRARLGLAQDKLALKADLDRTFVGRIARGALNPSLESIFKLAVALEIQPEELIRQVRLELYRDASDINAQGTPS